MQHLQSPVQSVILHWHRLIKDKFKPTAYNSQSNEPTTAFTIFNEDEDGSKRKYFLLIFSKHEVLKRFKSRNEE